MKAISLWQPWAQAMAVGAKRVETRDWPCVAGGQLFRGWMAICASKRTNYPKEEGGGHLSETLIEILEQSPESVALFESAGLVKVDEKRENFFADWCFFPTGKIVAVGWMQQCHRTEDFNPTELEAMWGGYGPDRFAWQYTEMWRLNEPLPVRGLQKLFDVQLPSNWQHQATKVY